LTYHCQDIFDAVNCDASGTYSKSNYQYYMKQEKIYKIILVDDDEDILEFLDYNFTKNGFSTKVLNNSDSVLPMVQNFFPDAIILDVMMPGTDGIELCENIRNSLPEQNPLIIMLTARGEDYSQIAGLEAGADDYIIKPINPKVLITKVRSLLKRRETVVSSTIKNGQVENISTQNLIIDRERYEITEGGKLFHLPRKEFELIELLASKPGKVFSRSEIYQKVWGDTFVCDRTIDVHIRKLREKFGDDFIKTIKGVGYKINE